ncbi:MAG: hypothetical protein ACOZQL_08960 [Myxococcota bacterium]
MKTLRTPDQLQHDAEAASTSGTDFLRMGLSVGAIGVVGAALGAVCPLCVVATPTLLGLGAVQKIRGLVLARQAKNPEPGIGSPPPAAPAATPEE